MTEGNHQEWKDVIREQSKSKPLAVPIESIEASEGYNEQEDEETVKFEISTGHDVGYELSVMPARVNGPESKTFRFMVGSAMDTIGETLWDRHVLG